MESTVAIRAKPARILALLESLGAAAIWASSFVLAKIALVSVGPLTLSALRYILAFLVLAPFLWRYRRDVRRLPPRTWRRLALIGLSSYTVGSGASFLALRYLPATTVSFLLSLISVPMVFAGAALLQERPSLRQVVGVAVCVAGTALFFSEGLAPGEPLGLLICAVGILAFVAFSIIGREVARDKEMSTTALTAIPLAFGGAALVLVALPVEGIPHMPASTWGIVFLLAVANTALAYILFNHSLQELTALESNVMQNLSPLMTAVWAWLILGDLMSWVQIVGIIIVIGGVLLVQLRSGRNKQRGVSE